MAFYHNTGTAVSYSEIMYRIWQHASSGLSCVTLASEGGNVAAYNGSAFGTPGDASFFDASGSYIVLQTPRADAVGMQFKLRRTTSVLGTYAPNGGWLSSTGVFGASLVSTEAPVIDVVPAASDAIYIGSTNTDTYNAGASVCSSIYVVWWDESAADFARGFVFGGLIPPNPTDTKACAYIGKVPAATTGSFAWCGAGTDMNLSWGEAARTTLTASLGKTNVSVDTWAKDWDGYYFGGELEYVSSAGVRHLGRVSPTLVRRIWNNVGLPDKTALGAGKWIACNGLALRVAA